MPLPEYEVPKLLEQLRDMVPKLEAAAVHDIDIASRVVSVQGRYLQTGGSISLAELSQKTDESLEFVEAAVAEIDAEPKRSARRSGLRELLDLAEEVLVDPRGTKEVNTFMERVDAYLARTSPQDEPLHMMFGTMRHLACWMDLREGDDRNMFAKYCEEIRKAIGRD